MPTVLSTRKDQIRQVAQNLFRERGYAATSMRDLAREIGIEPASLYSHIRSKEGLLKGICFEIGEAFFAGIRQIPAGGELSPEQRLKAAVEAHIQVIIENLDASAVFLHEWRFLSEPALAEFKRQRDEYEAYFRGLVREGICDGHFKAADEKFVVLTIFSSMNWIYEWYNPAGNMGVEEIVEKLVDLILNGIKAQP